MHGPPGVACGTRQETGMPLSNISTTMRMKIPSVRRLTILGGLTVFFGVAAALFAWINLSVPTQAIDVDTAVQVQLPALPPAKSDQITGQVSGRPVRITLASV